MRGEFFDPQRGGDSQVENHWSDLCSSMCWLLPFKAECCHVHTPHFVYCFIHLWTLELLLHLSLENNSAMNMCMDISWDTTCIFLKYMPRAWRDGSVVKSTGWASKEPRFNCQQLLHGSQSSVTPVLYDLTPLLTSEGSRQACGTQTYIQAKHPYA